MLVSNFFKGTAIQIEKLTKPLIDLTIHDIPACSIAMTQFQTLHSS